MTVGSDVSINRAAFFRILGKRITVVTREPRSYQFMMQQLSATIQLGNAACNVRTVQSSRDLDDIFYLWIFSINWWFSDVIGFFLLSRLTIIN
jgi:hypothetical protein